MDALRGGVKETPGLADARAVIDRAQKSISEAFFGNKYYLRPIREGESKLWYSYYAHEEIKKGGSPLAIADIRLLELIATWRSNRSLGNITKISKEYVLGDCLKYYRQAKEVAETGEDAEYSKVLFPHPESMEGNALTLSRDEVLEKINERIGYVEAIKSFVDGFTDTAAAQRK